MTDAERILCEMTGALERQRVFLARVLFRGGHPEVDARAVINRAMRLFRAAVLVTEQKNLVEQERLKRVLTKP